MNILVIQHVESEGPGTLGNFLVSIGCRTETVGLHRGETLPRDIAVWDALVSMGGPMNVYEDRRYPFLGEETSLLRRAIEADIPVLGICLGAQLAARASGAAVTRSPAREVGWGTVSLTGEGLSDRLFSGLPEEIPVVHWHEDMFEIPHGGTLLASSRGCPHQAFRYRRAYGLQFHLEVSGAMLQEWFAESEEQSAILDRFATLEGEICRCARRLYENFILLVAATRRQGLPERL